MTVLFVRTACSFHCCSLYRTMRPSFSEMCSPLGQLNLSRIEDWLYILERSILGRIPAEGTESFERDLFPAIVLHRCVLLDQTLSFPRRGWETGLETGTTGSAVRVRHQGLQLHHQAPPLPSRPSDDPFFSRRSLRRPLNIQLARVQSSLVYRRHKALRLKSMSRLSQGNSCSGDAAFSA